VLHGLISGFFLACIARVLVDAGRRRVSRTTVAAVGALAAEGLLVGLSGGDCPLGPFFRRRGDDTPFFGLLLPPGAAKLAVPVLGMVSAAAVVALVVRTRGMRSPGG